MKKYVSRHWDTKIELKNQWFLSLIRASDMFIKTIKTNLDEQSLRQLNKWTKTYTILFTH